MDLVATREVSKNSPGLVPEALVPVLEEFAGTMPAKIPRWRPPWHKVGHAPIELKKHVDRRRRSTEFRASDQVLVKLRADRAGIFHGPHRARIRKYEGPFTVVKRMGKLTYKLDLLLDFKAHPVFHVRNLQPFYVDAEDPERNQPRQEPILQQAPSTRRTTDR
uniref:Tf2-1-like SH3-like domain-containing protein n=1 Tax=Nymphaea colorata TaxID=210225 RepID=A0A5K0XJQ2_9MAGN